MFFKKSRKIIKLLEEKRKKLELDDSSSSSLRSYILLNPQGIIDESNKSIMGALHARKYVQTGYFKEGLGKNAERQYCLTALGRKQFEMEQAFSVLL